MKNGKIKKLVKNEKGSALILTLIVLVNAILIVTAIGSIAVVEQKTSSRTKNSTPALQMADSGLEYILKEVNNPANSIVSDCCGSFNASNGRCTISGFSDAVVYFLEDVSETRKVIKDGNELLSNVVAVRSIGSNGTGAERVTRALEASMD